MEKTVSEAIKYRRSVRRFDKNIEIDDNIVKKCIKSHVHPNGRGKILNHSVNVLSNKIIKVYVSMTM